MDIDTAIKTVATPAGNPIPPSELDAHIAEAHAGNPQRLTLAQHALAALRAALAQLEALGHNFTVAELKAAPPLEFPRMLHKAGGQQLTVENGEDLTAALAAGWTKAPGEEPAKPTKSAGPAAASRNADDD